MKNFQIFSLIILGMALASRNDESIIKPLLMKYETTISCRASIYRTHGLEEFFYFPTKAEALRIIEIIRQSPEAKFKVLDVPGPGPSLEPPSWEIVYGSNELPNLNIRFLRNCSGAYVQIGNVHEIISTHQFSEELQLFLNKVDGKERQFRRNDLLDTVHKISAVAFGNITTTSELQRLINLIRFLVEFAYVKSE